MKLLIFLVAFLSLWWSMALIVTEDCCVLLEIPDSGNFPIPGEVESCWEHLQVLLCFLCDPSGMVCTGTVRSTCHWAMPRRGN